MTIHHTIHLHSVFLGLLLTYTEVNLKVMPLALLFRPCPNMSRYFRPVAETVDDRTRDKQDLLVGAPVW